MSVAIRTLAIEAVGDGEKSDRSVIVVLRAERRSVPDQLRGEGESGGVRGRAEERRQVEVRLTLVSMSRTGLTNSVAPPTAFELVSTKAALVDMLPKQAFVPSTARPALPVWRADGSEFDQDGEPSTRDGTPQSRALQSAEPSARVIFRPLAGTYLLRVQIRPPTQTRETRVAARPRKYVCPLLSRSPRGRLRIADVECRYGRRSRDQSCCETRAAIQCRGGAAQLKGSTLAPPRRRDRRRFASSMNKSASGVPLKLARKYRQHFRSAENSCSAAHQERSRAAAQQTLLIDRSVEIRQWYGQQAGGEEEEGM